MIKILPLEENKSKVKPYYRLNVTLGYGDRCDDTYTESWVEIDDEKATRYAELTDEEMDEMDWDELSSLEHCISQGEAERIVKFFDSLWERKTKDGHNIYYIIINDGPRDLWWKDQDGMTDGEYEWFSSVYREFETTLFNPQVDVEFIWCGIVSVRIEYVDENCKIHKCEVV